MNGILAVNAFLKGEKFDNLHNHLVKAAESIDITRFCPFLGQGR